MNRLWHLKDSMVNSSKHFFSFNVVALKITLLYAIIGSVWIFFSDQLLEHMVTNPELLITFGALKEWFFVIIASVLLFVLVSRGMIRDKKHFIRILEKSEQEIKESLKELSDVNRALEEALLESEERHKSLFEYNFNSIYSLDLNGCLIEANPTFERVTGYAIDELRGKPFETLVVPHYLESTKEKFKKTVQGEAQRYESVIHHKEGYKIPLMVKNIPIIVNNEIVGVYGIALDLTEAKNAEKALKESEERYRKVVELSPQGIVVHQEGKIVYANQAALKSMKEDNPIGQSIFSYIHDDYHKMSKQRISETAIGTLLPFTEMKLIRRDGVVIDAGVGEMSMSYEGSPATLTMFRDVTERKQVESELKESEERYRRLVEFSPEPIVVHVNGFIKYANPACIKLLGATSLKELMSKSIIDFAHPDYVNLVQERINRLKNAGILLAPTQEKLVRLDGEIINVEVTGITLNHDGDPALLMMIHDITRRKKAEEALRQSEEKYRLIAENMTDLVGIVDVNGVVKYASPSYQFVLGFPPEDYEGKGAFDLVHPDDILHVQSQFKNMVMTKENHIFEFRYKHIQGNWVWVEAKGTPVIDESGNLIHFLMVAREITERKLFEEKLSYMAYHDTLTGVPNRRLFQERLEQCLKEAERYKRRFAVMYMDMDKFKHINDTLGHDIGDELLKQFSKRVQSCLRESDTIARQGGDEFTILLPEIKEERDALIIAERILTSLQAPWMIGEHVFRTTSSIGISYYPTDGTSVGELLKYADAALYEAKGIGRNNIKTYSALSNNRKTSP
ncbi:PAS domain S-box protein [Halalkalibacterium ligniniphilum]|uniref:PAS domain S-box protein n=1 Tax=Halalkalibacterium ligniniphilum TaxID=1134413 RepID=UPI000367C2C5|nr:PAS domain S-box protein [Halalkalibacterium ligniniphilum]